MSVPIVTNKQDEAIKAAAKLLGCPNAEEVVRVMYQMGYMDGLLAMASDHKQIVDAAMRSAL